MGKGQKQSINDIENAIYGYVTSLYSFTSLTFTSSQGGHLGPTLAQALANYNTVSNPWLSNTNYFNVQTQGIQEWTVPQTGVYRFTVTGGSGGIHAGSYWPCYPGAGAVVQGDITLNSGDVIKIVVGQKPTSTTGQSGNGAAGGGGSWVYTGAIGASGNLLFVAGGGGGTGHGSSATTGGNGKGGSSVNNSNESSFGVSFGVNARQGSGSAGNNGIGQGGKAGSLYNYGYGGGGAGWLSDGDNSSNASGYGGDRFIGGQGDDGTYMYGGFGGGGGGGGNGNSGGGGGGYTGGGGGHGWNNVHFGGGGGGGSYTAAGVVNTSFTEGASGINYASTTNGSVLVEVV